MPPTLSTRALSTSARRASSLVPPTPLAGNGPVAVTWFRDHAWEPAKPLVMRQSQMLPAAKLWFEATPDPLLKPASLFSQKVKDHFHVPMPYELRVSAETPKALREFSKSLVPEPGHHHGSQLEHDMQSTFEAIVNNDHPDQYGQWTMFNAPLGLLAKAAEFNVSKSYASPILTDLYIAQSKVEDLPAPLQDDLPVPNIVKETAKGDVYGSSIWLGLQPTYTPLHRDPNPNLFCQLLGTKTVRLMPPSTGDAIFAKVRRQLQNQRGAMMSARLRGVEMMSGLERPILYKLVWEEGHQIQSLVEVTVGPQDALFIPKGWWHSIRSPDDNVSLGRMNASVNWWFR